MDTVLRASFVYVVLLVIFRLSGKRSLAQVTTFDLILTLIISEAVQEALVDDDHSLTNAFLLVVTLISFDVLFSRAKQLWPRVGRILESTPVVILENGAIHKDRLDAERVDEGDILEAARQLQGVSRMDQIAYAVIERNGQITVVPKQ